MTVTTNLTISDAAEQLHKSSIVIDGLSFYYDGPTERLNPDRVTATNVTSVETYNRFGDAIEELNELRNNLRNDPGVLLVEDSTDIERAKAEGKVGLILGFQASLPLEDKLDRVQIFHDLGVRIIQLTYNDRDYTGDGCLEPVDGGLSRFGHSLIEEFARVGMVLDLSHVGRKTAMDTAEASKGPLVVSHANPRALTESPRNLDDELIKKVADKGGVVGICCWGPLIWRHRAGQQPTVDDYIDHIDYAADLIGTEHLGISTDSPCSMDQEWIDQHRAEFNEAFPEIAGEYRAKVSTDMHPEGFPGIADIRPVTEGLLKRGYKEDDIRGMLGGNFLKVFKQVWGK